VVAFHFVAATSGSPLIKSCCSFWSALEARGFNFGLHISMLHWKFESLNLARHGRANNSQSTAERTFLLPQTVPMKSLIHLPVATALPLSVASAARRLESSSDLGMG